MLFFPGVSNIQQNAAVAQMVEVSSNDRKVPGSLGKTQITHEDVPSMYDCVNS